MNVNIVVPNPNERGYGIGGKLTRTEWQQECRNYLLAGKDVFNRWQSDLNNHIQSKNNLDSGHLNLEVHYLDSAQPSINLGWSDPASNFVFDVSTHTFEENLYLSGYTFLTGAIFSGTFFNNIASFIGVQFDRDVSFFGATFGQGGYFTNAKFYRRPTFNYAIFKHAANFFTTNFFSGANFQHVEFHTEAYFDCAAFDSTSSFEGALFYGGANFSGQISSKDSKLQPFERISFAGARFEGLVDFSNREFRGSTNFGSAEGQPTYFGVAPYFHNCKLHQDTTFTDAIFPEQIKGDEAAARAYKTLRHAMSQQQSTREEQRFLKLELDAERAMAKGGVRFLYWGYKRIAGYGFSASRPFLYLVVMPFILGIFAYGFLVSNANCSSILSSSCQFSWGLLSNTIEFSLLQSLPPLGLDKMSEPLRASLFANQTPLWGLLLTVAVMLQKLFALSGLFFLALALRNLFKMK